MTRSLLLLVAVVLVGCASATPTPLPSSATPTSLASPPSSATPATTPSPRGPEVIFAGGEAALEVRIADTPETRARGLMWVESLPDDEGMAFVWDVPVQGTFWMKNTLIPLSIAFVGIDGRIHTIHHMTPCVTDTCKEYEANAPFTLAIEANGGWYERHAIEVGDTAVLVGGG